MVRMVHNRVAWTNWDSSCSEWRNGWYCLEAKINLLMVSPGDKKHKDNDTGFCGR